MNFRIIIFFFVLNLWSQSRVESLDINPKYHCEIYLPDSYTETKKYPLVYMNDGEGFFSPNSWDVKKILDHLIEKKDIEPLIYVAIHAGTHRLSRYLPYADPFITTNWGNYTPKAKAYAKDLRDQIFVQIEQNYSVNPKKRALFGLSFSGLFVTWYATQYDDVSFICAFSPSYWVNNYQIMSGLNTISDVTHWFDIGTAEREFYLPIE